MTGPKLLQKAEPVDRSRVVYDPTPTLRKFHASNRRVRGVRGPFGSGKSVGMCWEIFTRAQEQAPSPHDNVRRSRWVVTRNTYGELTSTTMKTWLAWFPEHRFGKVKDGSPITQMCRWGLPDGTKVELEMLFLALDRPDHLAKLLSLEITGAWMNEAREQPKAILDGLDGRIGRYPSAMDGGCTWRGIILDTNSPDDDHWWYVLAELTEDPTKKFLFLSQPAGDGPDAENLSWLDQTPDTLKHPPGSEVREARGRGYYEALKGGKTKNWIKIYVKGQYGTSEDGKPVYAEEWNDEIHIRPLVPIQGVPLQIGLDFGLTPAAVIGQTDARGRLLLLNEICGNGMAIRQFLEDALVPLLLSEYPQWYAKRQAAPAMIRLWGDPAGEQPSQTDARTCFQEVKDQKFRIRAARTNDFVPRRSAVAWFLSKMAGGLPSLLVDPKCKMIRKGFNGGYKYRRIQVTGEERYTDEPMKNAYSHCFTGDTMVAMADGVDRPIAAVKVGDFVLTPDGARMVEATMFRDDVSVDELRFSNGSVLRCTPDHPFIVEGRNVRADALQYSDVLQSVGETWAVNLSASRNSSRELPTTGSRLAITSLTTARTCIAWFGRMLVDPFRPVTISITGTGTGAIMTRAIWNAFLRPTMLHTTGARDCHVEATRPRLTWSVFDQPLRVGMRRMPAALGIASTARQVGRAVRPSACNASSATSHSSDLSGLPSAGSALHRVREWLGVRVASMMSSASASFAAPPSASTSTSRQPHAVRLVGRSPSVARARVYDLTIEGAHCFYAGGILVSNCHDALQYLALECGGVQGSMARQSDLPPPPRLPAPRAMHSSTGLLGN